jgi:hypothetical protein
MSTRRPQEAQQGEGKVADQLGATGAPVSPSSYFPMETSI